MKKSICFVLLYVSFYALLISREIPGTVIEVYKRASGHDLNLYRIDPPKAFSANKAKPAIVFFFGGGWTSGSPTQFLKQGQYLAKRGMVVFLADYRVESRQKTTPRECVLDGSSAIRYVRKNAKRFEIDPDRIVAGGGSAGGHVAATTGICEGFDEASEDLSVSARSNALVLFNPVYDNGEKGYGHERVKKWYPQISPIDNITEDDPSAIVFLGSKDSLIPVGTAEKFKEKQTSLGIHSELHVYEGQPHGFFNLGKGGPEIFKDTLLKTDAFLVKLGYLEGEADRKLIDKIVEEK